MKILFAGPYPPVKDGIGESTWMLGHEMQHAGHEIAVVVPYRVAGLPDEVLGSLAARGAERGRLQQELAAWQPDVVHVQFAIACFGLRTIALARWLGSIRRDLGIPVVVTMHEPARESALLPVLGRAAHRALARRCEHFIVHTEMARSAVAAGAGVPDGMISVTALPAPRFQAATSTSADLRARFGLGDARILLAFGFIHVDKGLDDLIDALLIVRESDPAVLEDVRVVIAGDIRPRHGVFRVMGARDRRHRARLIRRIRRAGLGETITRTGYVPDGEVAAWFGLAAGVVLPYRAAEQSGVEALALSAGVPALTSSAGGLAELSADARWTFPPRAPARLAETLKDFLTTTAGREPPAQSGPSAAGIATIAAATLDLYRAVRAAEPASVSDVS